ncbi:hypothetical protein K8R30_00455 [archaeon]|nr:hypothetical protein [archaeon]
MGSVFDVVCDGSRELMMSLEDELKGVLHCVAHNDCCSLEYLRERREFLSRKYDSELQRHYLGVASLGIPAKFIGDAYSAFELLVDDYEEFRSLGKEDKRRIEEECGNILGEFLEIPDPNDFDEETREEILRGWGKTFAEFKRKTGEEILRDWGKTFTNL